MSSENSELLYCYNKGCGNKFNPNDNKEDSCTFHPGNPVFHDAYKGWSCCNKKCTDFTEFLSMKGCTKSFHSNVKPPEPPKPVVDKTKASEVIEYKAPIPKVSEIQRPPFDAALTKMIARISDTVRAQMENLVINKKVDENTSEIAIGTSCKNGGCKSSYKGKESISEVCVHHPGIPVFHEGMKYWSCCNKKTTDFSAFLEQIGCKNGNHVWIKEKSGKNQVSCRYDWHQTGMDVVISVYAKKYDPVRSAVELNPIRAKIHLYFPQEESSFDLDLELQGVIDVEKSSVGMLETKVEIKLKKVEPGSWSKLNLPRVEERTSVDKQKEKVTSEKPQPDVDLNDIY